MAKLLWRGPSPIDGAPIVAVLTGDEKASSNAKTGAMMQVFILREDIRPMAALAEGADVSICGGCPHRMGGRYGKRTCYVNVANAPTAVWGAVHNGKADGLPTAGVFGRGLRMGAYGDPALIPTDVWDNLLERVPFHTAYTHLWQGKHGQSVRGRAMASADTLKEANKALGKGWGVFYVRPVGAPLPEGATECLATAKGVQCADCGLCDGTPGRFISIEAHGVARKRVRELPVIG